MKLTIGKFHFSDTYTFLPNNIFTLESFYLPSSQTIRFLLAELRKVNGGQRGVKKRERCLIHIRGWEALAVVKWPPVTNCFIVTPPEGATDFPAGWIRRVSSCDPD